MNGHDIAESVGSFNNANDNKPVKDSNDDSSNNRDGDDGKPAKEDRPSDLLGVALVGGAILATTVAGAFASNPTTPRPSTPNSGSSGQVNNPVRPMRRRDEDSDSDSNGEREGGGDGNEVDTDEQIDTLKDHLSSLETESDVSDFLAQAYLNGIRPEDLGLNLVTYDFGNFYKTIDGKLISLDSLQNSILREKNRIESEGSGIIEVGDKKKKKVNKFTYEAIDYSDVKDYTRPKNTREAKDDKKIDHSTRVGWNYINPKAISPIQTQNGYLYINSKIDLKRKVNGYPAPHRGIDILHRGEFITTHSGVVIAKTQGESARINGKNVGIFLDGNGKISYLGKNGTIEITESIAGKIEFARLKKLKAEGKLAGSGNAVTISHLTNRGREFDITYMHLRDEITLKVNTYVKEGITLGQVGTTGLSTGDHPHYQIITNAKPTKKELKEGLFTPIGKGKYAVDPIYFINVLSIEENGYDPFKSPNDNSKV
jgi:murein DD-endopeptidase MepM/ murein hydrolase activator NlpD